MLLQLEKKVRNGETGPEAANPAKAAALTRTTLVPNSGWDRKASPKSHHMPLAAFSQIRLLTLTAASSCPLLLSPPSHRVLDVPQEPSHPHDLVLPHLPHSSGQLRGFTRFQSSSTSTLVSPGVSPGCFTQTSRFVRLFIFLMSCKQESCQWHKQALPMHHVQCCLGLTLTKP